MNSIHRDRLAAIYKQHIIKYYKKTADKRPVPGLDYYKNQIETILKNMFDENVMKSLPEDVPSPTDESVDWEAMQDWYWEENIQDYGSLYTDYLVEEEEEEEEEKEY